MAATDAMPGAAIFFQNQKKNMTQEELIKKIKKSILEILKEENPSPKEGLEAAHSAVLTITIQFGEIMTEDAKAFAIDVLEQDIQHIQNNI